MLYVVKYRLPEASLKERGTELQTCYFTLSQHVIAAVITYYIKRVQ